MTPVIKIQKPVHAERTRQARHDWSVVRGKDFKLKPPSFLHTDGQYYCNITGGIAYPTTEQKGIVIIIGVQNEPEVTFRVFEYYEDSNVFNLIKSAVMLRMKYGFGLDSRILPYFYGDQEKYQTLIAKTSEILEDKLGYDKGLYVKDLVDLRMRHAFPLYVRQLFYSGEQFKKGKGPGLDLNDGGSSSLRGYIHAFDHESAEKGRTEDFPAVGLLAGMIHSLMIERPWLDDITMGEAFNIAI